mgnify:CR=1 FL=1
MSDIFKINRQLSVTTTRIKFLEQKISLKKEYKKKMSKDARKMRAHKLITKGALLEMLNMENEDNEVLLGFFSSFNQEEKEIYKKIGKEIFDENKRKKKMK